MTTSSPESSPERPQERPEGSPVGLAPSEPFAGAQAGADGLDPHNVGPTIAECAEADRLWPLQKHGE